MTSFESTVALQYEVINRMCSFVNNYKKTAQDRFTLGYLAARAAGLRELWGEFTLHHRTLVTSASVEMRKSHEYFTSEYFDKYEQIYYDVSGRIAQKTLDLTPAPCAENNPPPPVAAENPPHHIPHIQLPRLNVPNFSGKYEEWPSFHDLFLAAVHNNPSLRASQKLQYLKSLLKDTAELMLRHTQITDDNYAQAWDDLQARFNNKRALVTVSLRSLLTQRVADETASSLRTLLDTTKECTNALKQQQIDIATWDSILVYVVSQYIPKTSLDLWEQSLTRNELPTFNALLEFLENRFRTLEFAPEVPQQSRSRSKPQTFHTVAASCRFCQNSAHPLRLCPKFIELQPSQRIDHINKSKLCKNCFAYSHQTQACASKGRCNKCGQRHHSMLHVDTQQSPQLASTLSSLSTQATSQNQAAAQVHTTTHMTQPLGTSTDDSILATALVNITAFDGSTHSFRALLDNASHESFVSKRLVQFLGLKPTPTSMTISGVGQSQAPKPLGQVDFDFGSHHDTSFTMHVNAIVLPLITYNLPTKPLIVDQQLISNLQLADPSYGTPSDIDILLSASIVAAITLPSIRKKHATIALKTYLGWVLFGEATGHPAPHQRACFHTTTEDSVSNALQQFWKLEEVVGCVAMTPSDAKCEQIYADTHSRERDGRYCVHLPFKADQLPLLGPSRDRAVSRFLQIERRLTANNQLREEYSKCIHEYINLDHMRPTSATENEHRVTLPNGSITYSSYYLPHHAVIKIDSSSTKLRVVFDASSKTLNGTSLNETLHIGPGLQDTLFSLLLRWRTHRVVIKADITKMYRQVLVNKIHQPYQRIIWRDSPDEPLHDYELRTVTFGTAAAPYLAIKTIHQLSEDEHERYPIGATTIRHDFYVDDLLSGADSVTEAKEKQRQVENILQCGGFQICKWSSNCADVIEGLDETAKEICSNTDSTLKTLGVLWSPQLDALSIKVASRPSSVTTKRELLSEIAKLYDPLGWIAPSIVSMKMLLQKLWLAGLSWDEPLPNAIQNDWTSFNRQLPCIEQIRINRWLNTTSQVPIELHGFSDASQRAYAAAIYVRVKTSNDEWSTHLIAAKTRVAPVNQVSLPRLELCAAVLLTKLLATVNSSIKATTIHAWTDSEIVLAWLQGHPNRWTTFVANRISEIHTLIDSAAWHHVPTKDNPADCASRGMSPELLVDHTLWWDGPLWLKRDEQHWPQKQKKDIAPATIECKKQCFVTIAINDTLSTILANCITLAKAVRVTAYMRRMKTHKLRRTEPITVAELNHAKTLLIRHTQQTFFSDEHAALSSKQPISVKSKLITLNPVLDENQMLRVGGRLQHANIPFAARHPLIIPRKSRLTELIVKEAHAQTLHGGAALMLAHLRNMYWIVDARNTIRHQIHACNTCFRYAKNTLSQIMGSLPQPRVTASHPFGHTGLDYAGPITIRLRRHPGRPLTSKGYICLFVCLATKAIHLELVGDMSAATFLAAFNRFTSRRGLPSDMYSDNGTYFVRAAHDIDADMRTVQTKFPHEIANSAALNAIQWHFIPPAAPHFGGLWEAGIKSTKHHLKRIVGDGSFTYEEMSTTLCQIESCLNSRPLCPVTNDPNDFNILTPGHFLIGRPLLSRPQPSVLEIPTNRLSYWQRIYKTTEQFWRQWQTEYLTRLQQRPKWLAETNNIEKGELVLLKEDCLPPSQWKLARIIDTHPGADGHTRVVTIKTPTTTLKRPIVKICKLPSQ